MVSEHSVNPRRVLVRAAVWSLIGVLYAPLYVVLHQLLSPALSGYAPALAAAAAGGVGAAFYGARHLALSASLVGVAVAMIMLFLVGPEVQAWSVAALTAVAGLAVGGLVDFPRRCTANVGAKFVIGAGMSGLAGLMLAGIATIAGLSLPIAAAVALLVSVTGVLYVSVLGLWRGRGTSGGARPRFCSLTEGIVIAGIASMTAAGLTGFAGIFADGPPGALTSALIVTAADVPVAVLGGLTAGAVTGGLLELFEFAWVDVS